MRNVHTIKHSGEKIGWRCKNVCIRYMVQTLIDIRIRKRVSTTCISYSCTTNRIISFSFVSFLFFSFHLHFFLFSFASFASLYLFAIVKRNLTWNRTHVLHHSVVVHFICSLFPSFLFYFFIFILIPITFLSCSWFLFSMELHHFKF